MAGILTTAAARVTASAFFAAILAVTGLPGTSCADPDEGGAKTDTFMPGESGAVWTRDGNPAGKELTWVDARDFVQNLGARKYLGCAGWRLPTREELTAMAAYLNGGNADGEGVTPVMDYYWSSTDDSLEGGYADAVNLEDGSVDSCDKTEFNYVWPVCGG